MKIRSITQTDLTTSLSSIADDATIVLNALDIDKNGKIEKNEFVFQYSRRVSINHI